MWVGCACVVGWGGKVAVGDLWWAGDWVPDCCWLCSWLLQNLAGVLIQTAWSCSISQSQTGHTFIQAEWPALWQLAHFAFEGLSALLHSPEECSPV